MIAITVAVTYTVAVAFAIKVLDEWSDSEHRQPDLLRVRDWDRRMLRRR